MDEGFLLWSGEWSGGTDTRPSFNTSFRLFTSFPFICTSVDVPSTKGHPRSRPHLVRTQGVSTHTDGSPSAGVSGVGGGPRPRTGGDGPGLSRRRCGPYKTTRRGPTTTGPPLLPSKSPTDRLFRRTVEGEGEGEETVVDLGLTFCLKLLVDRTSVGSLPNIVDP